MNSKNPFCILSLVQTSNNLTDTWVTSIHWPISSRLRKFSVDNPHITTQIGYCKRLLMRVIGGFLPSFFSKKRKRKKSLLKRYWQWFSVDILAWEMKYWLQHARSPDIWAHVRYSMLSLYPFAFTLMLVCHRESHSPSPYPMVSLISHSIYIRSCSLTWLYGRKNDQGISYTIICMIHIF